jgi:hypothetical protein
MLGKCQEARRQDHIMASCCNAMVGCEAGSRHRGINKTTCECSNQSPLQQWDCQDAPCRLEAGCVWPSAADRALTQNSFSAPAICWIDVSWA